jgi:hypothetical protein
MTDAIIRCGDCKHFRRSKAEYAMMFAPIVGQIMMPLLARWAYEFGKCARKGDETGDPGFGRRYSYASTERKFECGKGARYFERRVSFFAGRMSFFRQKVEAIRGWLNGPIYPFGDPPKLPVPQPPTDDDCRIAYEWLREVDGVGRLPSKHAARLFAAVYEIPAPVSATLRKLGA